MEQQQQYVGIDLHRRRSVIVRRNEAGETLETVRIDNDPVALAAELAKAGEHPEVILEATYGWYWAADVIQECGGNVHLAHPLGNNWGNRRVKNDERDATDLVDLLRLGRLAEAWVAPPPLRELRELIRYRAKLVHLRSNFKAQVHSVLAKEGVAVPMSDLFGVGGNRLLDEVRLGDAYRIRVESLRDLIEHFDREIAMVEARSPPSSPATSAIRRIQAIPGVGPGAGRGLRGRDRRHLEVQHRPAPVQLGRAHPHPPRVRREGPPGPHHQAGLAHRCAGPRSRRSPASAATPPIRRHHRQVGERRGNQIGRVAAARKLLILVYYGLRDGEIRCLAQTG